MASHGFFYWLGAVAVLFGVLGLISLLAFWVDHSAKRWARKEDSRHGITDEKGPDNDRE